ncbi:MAG: hypothetical protein EAZ23_01165 [Oscillatoriales cyanobacterium]|nr:MAG: hypothetical protein EAZ23_01165 [Oscillatoriales cyanobacterium]
MTKIRLKICVFLLEIATIAIFAPQLTKSAIAQSITDKSCVADIVGEDIGSQVNIRSGAGSIFSVVGTVSVGNLVIVANDDQNKSAVVSPLSWRSKRGGTLHGLSLLFYFKYAIAQTTLDRTYPILCT